MNILETYVTNITKVEKLMPEQCAVKGDFYAVTADYDCWGNKHIQQKRILCEQEYQLVLEKGYYLT